MVHRISSVEGNLFIFGLVCYFCPGSQKINILTAQYKRISNEQGELVLSVHQMINCFSGELPHERPHVWRRPIHERHANELTLGTRLNHGLRNGTR